MNIKTAFYLFLIYILMLGVKWYSRVFKLKPVPIPVK